MNQRPDKQRLFFAVWPVPTALGVLAELRTAMRPLVPGRWLSPSRYHVTLAFLGAVAGTRMPELISMADRIRSPGFCLELDRWVWWPRSRVLALVPRLAERRTNGGAQLSGGEQQMLAIGRALMTNPRLLILDEATEGLAPVIRAEIWRCLRAIKGEGQAILIVDKNLDALAHLAERHAVIEKGRIAWHGDAARLRSEADTVRSLLTV